VKIYKEGKGDQEEKVERCDNRKIKHRKEGRKGEEI
jgi:hypothetical protein